MSESTEEKTEEGSAKKVQDALEKGNVPFSREASVFFSLGAMLIVVSFALKTNVQSLMNTLSQLFANPGKSIFATPADTLNLFNFAAQSAAAFLLPIMTITLVAGLAGNFAQGMPRVAAQRIAPKWSKLSPFGGVKRLLGRDGQVEFLKNLLKLTIVSSIVALVLRKDVQAVVETMYMEPGAIGGLTLGMIGRLLAGAMAAYTLIAVGDFAWSRIRWRRDLRMSKQEVKDEMKQAEGDPFFKAKRRSLMMDRARKRMMADVPRATLVIANPTHYAIALRYMREEGGAPVVLAKGQDLIALKIREIAETNGIPVIEDKALARSMYDHVEVSQLIPPEFYKAVAELIHFLSARGPRPISPTLKG